MCAPGQAWLNQRLATLVRWLGVGWFGLNGVSSRLVKAFIGLTMKVAERREARFRGLKLILADFCKCRTKKKKYNSLKSRCLNFSFFLADGLYIFYKNCSFSSL